MTQTPNDPNAPQPPTPQPSTTPPPSTSPAATPATPDEKTMGMLCHLLGLVGFLGPLIIWLIKKDTMPFVNDQGKESLNFQITLVIAYAACMVLNVIFCIGSILAFAVWIVALVFIIKGTMSANNGVAYRYPFAIRLVK